MKTKETINRSFVSSAYCVHQPGLPAKAQIQSVLCRPWSYGFQMLVFLAETGHVSSDEPQPGNDKIEFR